MVQVSVRSRTDSRIVGSTSVKTDSGCLSTPTGACFGFLDRDRLSRLGATGKHKACPKAQAVVHLHSTYAIVVSCLADVDPSDALPRLHCMRSYGLGKVPLIQYARPAQPELVGIVRDHAGEYIAMLLANHGPVVCGTSVRLSTNE